MKSWVVICSRKGTHDKGMWEVAKHPLVAWVLAATEGRRRIVTTDSPRVRALARSSISTLVVDRPEELRGGESGMHGKSVVHALQQVGAWSADIVHIVQPTYPFVQEEDLLRAEAALASGKYRSFQTVTRVPHGLHALNQREIVDGSVAFVNEEERRQKQTSQSKSERWAFGNLVSLPVGNLGEGNWLFPAPCAYAEIPSVRAFDVNAPEDLPIADALVYRGLVSNPFSKQQDWNI